VIANSMSSRLRYTVSTAAGTCETTIVTNNKLLVTSAVFVDIAGYSGGAGTNGIPLLVKSDPPDVATYTISLCNVGSGALSGTLYIESVIFN